LYQPVTDGRVPLQPGPIALQIAELWRTVGPLGLTVVTTNYDLLLERALRAVGVSASEVATMTVEQPAVDPDKYAVIHLHGIVREPGENSESVITDDPVLAEDEYYAVERDPRAEARRQLCERLLSAGSSLFLGTSLTDPNLLSYLYQSAAAHRSGSPRHFALTVKQSDQPPGIDVSAMVLTVGRETADTRLGRMNVTALAADFFCQNAQFLAEIRHRRRFGLRHVPHDERLQLWATQAVARGILPHREEAFLNHQPRLRGALAVTSNMIAELLDSKPSLRCPGERLALHLWVYDPQDHSLVFIARSDQQFFNPATLERQPIGMPVARLVVEAVCSGAVLEASGDDLRSSRWRSMLVTPIVLGDECTLTGGAAAGYLPVGALVLASDQDDPRGLGRLRDSPPERTHLVEVLARIGAVLLGTFQTEVSR